MALSAAAGHDASYLGQSGWLHARQVAHRITQNTLHSTVQDLPLKLLLSSVSCTRCGASWAYSSGRLPSSRLLAKRSHLRKGDRSGWEQCNKQGATRLHAGDARRPCWLDEPTCRQPLNTTPPLRRT